VLDEQGERWRRGECLTVERFVEFQPALLKEPESLLDLIYHEVLLREERGESPGLADYLSRFPALLDQLRDQFLVHRFWIESA
jgi:hypothetical protein